jgi:hypothetical protein
MKKRMILLLMFSLTALQLFSDHSWEQLTSSVSEPQGRGTQMVYDSLNCCIVLFGGRYGDGKYDNLNDTWIYRKKRDRQKNVRNCPMELFFCKETMVYVKKSQWLKECEFCIIIFKVCKTGGMK